MIFQDANEDNEWILSWWKSSQHHVRQFFSFTLAISFNVKKEFQKESRTFFILLILRRRFFSEVFFQPLKCFLRFRKEFYSVYVVTSWWFNGFCFVWKLKWMFPKKQKFVAKDDFKRDHICCKDFFEATWWKNCFDFLLNSFKELTPIFN